MAVATTEREREGSKGLDAQPSDTILDVLLKAQCAAAAAVRPALPAIARAAEMAADSLGAGGKLGYAAAGSSGLMALADGLELPGTFGIARDKIAILMAGGANALRHLAGVDEDDWEQAGRDVAGADLRHGDCLLGISASGATPYAVAALRAARERGARTVAIANNEGAALFEHADVKVLIATPSEVIAGSTRMGAGTAQKIALNLFSTLMAIRLGHVHDGHMVNLTADNAKLKARAERIVSAVGDCDAAAARLRLKQASGSVKIAIMLSAGADNATMAERLLEKTGHRLRPALAMINASESSAKPAA